MKNLEKRKNDFIKSVTNTLSGVLYEKKRIVYDVHSDNFTMFLYFGKRNTCILDAIFTLESNYFYGSMNEIEKKEYSKNHIEFFINECKFLSKLMEEDLIFSLGLDYAKKVKLNLF